MNQSMKLAAIFTLAISAGLAGCMAESADEATMGDDEAQPAPAPQATEVSHEKTGEASQKCGLGGFGGCAGLGLPGFGGLGCAAGGLFGGFPTPASYILSGLTCSGFTFGPFPPFPFACNGVQGFGGGW